MFAPQAIGAVVSVAIAFDLSAAMATDKIFNGAGEFFGHAIILSDNFYKPKNVWYYSVMIKLVSPNFSDLFEPNIAIGKFPDGDSHITIPQLPDCRGQDVTVYHRLYPKQNTSLVVLLFIIEQLKQAGAKTVSAVCPYLPYARQDKQKLPGELTLAYSTCRLLAAAGLNKLITFDCHFLNDTGRQKFAGLTIENLSLGPALVARAKEIFHDEAFEIIGPDEGSRYLVAEHGGLALTKVRKDYQGAKVAYRDVHEVTGDLDVSGKNVLILDDIISSGSTMVKCLEKVSAAGAKKIICAATHGLFLFDCVEKMKVFSAEIFASDSIPGTLAKVSIKEQLVKL